MKTLGHFAIDIGASTLNDTHEFASGVKIFIDPMFKPTEHAKIHGTVALINTKHPEVPIGAEMYYPYLYSDDSHRVIADGRLLVMLHQSVPWCYVVDGKINMLNGFILVTPERFVANQDIVDTMARMGMFMEPEVVLSASAGTIAHSSNPEEIGYGIHFPEHEAFLNTIEGTGYYVMESKDAIRTDDLIKQMRDGEKSIS